MFNNSDIKINSDVKTEIKINDKGKLLGPFMGDQGGDPCEKITWRTEIKNKHLTRFNLKMLPSFDGKEKYTPRIHPNHLQNSSNKMVKKAYCRLLNLRLYHCFTDDSFFTGELIKSALTIFSKNNKYPDFNQQCNGLAKEYDKNLRQFVQRFSNLKLAEEECGGGTSKFLRNLIDRNYSNRNGCAMRIPLVGIFADTLSQLWKIVWASIRNTHSHGHSFDAARSVASIVFMACGGLGQKSMANYINLEFKPKYARFATKNDVNKRHQHFGYEYENENHFLDFDMDKCTLQSVYNDRFKYKYTETALDTVVVALRIIRVAGSFYEAWALAKSYGGDADTLQTIVCSMAAVVFGVPEEFQKLTNEKLATYQSLPNYSPEIAGYAKVSNDMDNEFSSWYPENIPLDVQLKQTLDMIKDIKQPKQDININAIEQELGLGGSKQIDEFSYQREHHYEFFWNENPKTVLSCFVAIPIILICMAFYFLPTNLASILLIVICIVGFISFHFTSKTCTNSKIKELKNSYLSEDINNDRSNKLKNLIQSIIEEWNFNLDASKNYDLNQRKCFEYEPDGKQPEFNQTEYQEYLENMKSFYQEQLNETKDINTINTINAKIEELNNATPKKIYQDYLDEERAFYDKVNAHNRATAKYKTRKKREKLNSLTPEQVNKISDYVKEINEIAKDFNLSDRINLNQMKFVEQQEQQIYGVPQQGDDIKEEEMLINEIWNP